MTIKLYIKYVCITEKSHLNQSAQFVEMIENCHSYAVYTKFCWTLNEHFMMFTIFFTVYSEKQKYSR